MNPITRTTSVAAIAMISAFTLIPASDAAVLFEEEFDYTLNAPLPVSPSSGDVWGSVGSGTTTVVPQTLTPYASGGLSVTSTGGQITNVNRRILHDFSESDLLTTAEREAGGKLYISFVATMENSSTDGGVGGIKFGGSANVRIESGVQWKQTTWGLSSPSGFQSSGVSTLNASLIIFEIAYVDATVANINYYVNPTATVSEGTITLTSSPSATLSNQTFGYLNQININADYAGLVQQVDAIRIGTSLDDVLTAIPEANSSLWLGVAGLVCFVASRTSRSRRRSSEQKRAVV